MAKAKTRPVREHQPLTKNDLLESSLREQEVYIESLDRWVWVRELSAAQVQASAKKILKSNGDVDYGRAASTRVEASLQQVIDGPGGKPMFNAGDIKEIQTKSGAVVSEIVQAVQTISGQKKTDDNESIFGWLDDNHPEILAEYREESPIDEAESNFTGTEGGGSPSV